MGHYPEESSAFIREFFKRTLHNHDTYIEDNRLNKGRYPYDVTQTVNSFLGLVIFLKDAEISFSSELDNFVIAHTPSQWSCLNGNNQVEEKNFKNYLTRLRNAVSHRKIKSIPDDNNEIIAIEFRDGKNGGCFCTELSIDAIKDLIELLKQNILGAH
jgi:hypothetical protein